jgi:hypothetical protein
MLDNTFTSIDEGGVAFRVTLLGDERYPYLFYTVLLAIVAATTSLPVVELRAEQR